MKGALLINFITRLSLQAPSTSTRRFAGAMSLPSLHAGDVARLLTSQS